MLSFLSAVEEYQIEINALYKAPSLDENLPPLEIVQREFKRLEVEKANEPLGLVGNGLFAHYSMYVECRDTDLSPDYFYSIERRGSADCTNIW